MKSVQHPQKITGVFRGIRGSLCAVELLHRLNVVADVVQQFSGFFIFFLLPQVIPVLHCGLPAVETALIFKPAVAAHDIGQHTEIYV